MRFRTQSRITYDRHLSPADSAAGVRLRSWRSSLFEMLASRLNRTLSDPAVICHFLSRWPRVITEVSNPFICFGGFSEKPIEQLASDRNRQRYTRKQRWRISGKPPFRLAAVANERINSGHAQREREAFQALWEQGALTNMAVS